MKTSITPEMAKNILENNSRNRKINKGRVKRFKEEILNGFWVYNGESIIISTTGKLLDGQHRLLAVIEAETSIEINLITDVEDTVDGIDTFLTINTENRTNNDALYIAGYKTNTKEIYNYIGLLEAYNHKKLIEKPNGFKMLNHEIVEIANIYGEENMLTNISKARKLSEDCELLSLNYWLLMVSTIGTQPGGSEFLRKLSTYDITIPPNNISTLLKFFKKLRDTESYGIKYTRARWFAIFKSFKAESEGKTIEKFVIPRKMVLDYVTTYDKYED